MRSRKRKTRLGMVEGWIQPVVRIVAHQAIRRISLGLMVLGSVILGLMAGDAVRFGIQNGPFMAI